MKVDGIHITGKNRPDVSCKNIDIRMGASKKNCTEMYTISRCSCLLFYFTKIINIYILVLFLNFKYLLHFSQLFMVYNHCLNLTIDGSTDRCCIAVVTNEHALLSGSDQPVRNL